MAQSKDPTPGNISFFAENKSPGEDAIFTGIFK
jgi:hypothetical protein